MSDEKTIADVLFVDQHLVGLKDEFYSQVTQGRLTTMGRLFRLHTSNEISNRGSPVKGYPDYLIGYFPYS